MPVGANKITVSKEFPYLVGKLIFFFRNNSVKDAVTVKTIDNDVSRSVYTLSYPRIRRGLRRMPLLSHS